MKMPEHAKLAEKLKLQLSQALVFERTLEEIDVPGLNNERKALIEVNKGYFEKIGHLLGETLTTAYLNGAVEFKEE